MRRHRTPIHRFKENEYLSIGEDSHPNREHNLCSEDVRVAVSYVSSWYRLELSAIDAKIRALNSQKAHISDIRKQTIMGILNNKRNVTAGDAAINAFKGIPPEHIAAVIVGAMKHNHVLAFSQTKKGNAVIVSVYDGKDNDKVYPETTEELAEVIETLADAYRVDLTSSVAPPPRSKKKLSPNVDTNDDV